MTTKTTTLARLYMARESAAAQGRYTTMPDLRLPDAFVERLVNLYLHDEQVSCRECANFYELPADRALCCAHLSHRVRYIEALECADARAIDGHCKPAAEHFEPR